MFAYFFFSALYLQLVLEYSPLEVGLAYLPGTVVWGASSLLLSDRLVMRYGIKTPLLAGLGLMTLALVLLARSRRRQLGDRRPAGDARSGSAPGSRST